jgi:hypothetical protein
MDRIIHACTNGLDCLAIKVVLLQPRLTQRTLAWVEPEPKAKGQNAQKAVEIEVESIYRPLSTLYIGHATDANGVVPDSSQGRMKEKTRGKPPESTARTEDHAQVNDEVATSKRRIPVDARALKVLRTLFYDPTVTSTPGEVPWMDFVHTMKSAGDFSAEKMYGSVWSFTKITEGEASRIQFHEPHPKGKLSFNIARRYGRRLNRRYGWERDHFELK